MAKPKNPVLHAVKLTVVGFALLIVAIVLLALLVNNIVRSESGIADAQVQENIAPVGRLHIRE